MLIGEVARRSGVSARMLRHYESLGLLRPSGRTGSGYREYSGEDIRRIFHIESLRSLGLSLREIGRALDDPGFTPSALVDDLIRQTRERIAAETDLLTRLRRIDAAEPAGWEDVLQVVAVLQALGSKSPAARQRAALSAGDEVPVEALVEAVLRRRSLMSPEPFGGRWLDPAPTARRCWRRGSTRPFPRCGNVPSGLSPSWPVTNPPPTCGMPSRTPMSWCGVMRPLPSALAAWPMRSRCSST